MLRQHLRLLAFLLVPLALVCEGCGSSPSTATASPTSAPLPHFKVGDAVPVGTTWLITINNATISSGDSSYMPPAGKALLILDISQENRTSQAVAQGGAADWRLRDSTGTSFKVVKSDYGELLAGTVAVADASRGELVYEVLDSVHQFILMYAPAAGGDQAIWDISV